MTVQRRVPTGARPDTVPCAGCELPDGCLHPFLSSTRPTGLAIGPAVDLGAEHALFGASAHQLTRAYRVNDQKWPESKRCDG